MRHPAIRWILSGALLTCVAGVQADTADLIVRAVIRPRVTVRMVTPPPALQITEHDLATGYVDAPAPLSLAVSSNTTRGVLLMFASVSEHVQRTEVTGPQGTVLLGAAGGAILVPDVQPRRLLDLRFRFYLSPETPPGRYAWPLQLAAES